MINVVFMITIAKRNESEDLLKCFERNKVMLTLGRYGRGTATNEIMDCLGIGDKEKCVLFSTMQRDKAKIIFREFIEMNTNRKNQKIISFTIPISSVGGTTSLESLIGENQKEEDKMEIEVKNELVVVVANRGYTSMVMDAARKAGAKGGTVVHARGTGVEQAEKFFGITIGAEKEMIFIVTTKEEKPAIMKKIMEDAGVETEAASIIFSLPVTDVIGMNN